MACRESRSREILLPLGLIVLATSLCHCASLSGLNTLNKLGENSKISQSDAKGSHQHHGRLLIGQNSLRGAILNGSKATENLMEVETDYQADMGWVETKLPTGQDDRPKPDEAAVQHLLRLEPKVECTVDSMMLQVQDATSTPQALFFVDRGYRLSPLPLSKLPPSCGYTIRSTTRDLVLVAPYDGCFVVLEEDSYVLPLRWLGLPVRMSCPLMRQLSSNPPMVTCHAEGMVVKTEWIISVSKIQVNLNGNWEPLMKASQKCQFSIIEHPEGVVISVHYTPCLETKDGLYTLELAGDGEIKITCPSLLAAQPEFTNNYTTSLHHSVSVHTPDQTPAKFASPQVRSFPQNPEMSNKNPIQERQDIDQSHLPYYLFHPSFFYPNPSSPVSTPPVESLKPKSTLSSDIQTTKDQRRQTFYHFPFHSQPPKPETPPTQLPMSKPSTYSLDEHLLSNPFTLPPALPQKPLEPPESQPVSQEQKPVHPFFYPLSFVSLASFVDSPPHLMSLQKLPGTPQGQGENQAPQPEAPWSQVYQTLYSRFQPKPEIQPAKIPTVLHQPPQPQAPWSQVHHRFYHYPSHIHPKPGIQLGKIPTAVHQPFSPRTKPEIQQGGKPIAAPQPPQLQTSQGQVHQSFLPQTRPEIEQGGKSIAASQPPQLETPLGQSFYPQTRPEIQHVQNPMAGSQPPQLRTPQGQVHQPFKPFYPQPNLEIQSSENPTVPQSKQAKVPKGQVHQPMHMYPHLKPDNQPTVAPQPATEMPVGQAHTPCKQFKMTGAGTNNDPTENPVQSTQSPTTKHPQGQMHHPFYPFYYPQNPKPPQPVMVPIVIYIGQQVTSPARDQKSAEPAIPQTSAGGVVPQIPLYMQPAHCPQFCPPGSSNCCPQTAFHQHLHHVVPVGLGSKDAPVFFVGLPFLPSGTSLPQKPAEASTMQSTTTSTSIPMSPQSPRSGNAEQPYLQPPDGIHPALPGGNPSKTTNLEVPSSYYFEPNSLYPHWPYLPQKEELHNLPKIQSSAQYSVPSKSLASGNEPANPVVQYEPYNIQPPKQQHGQLSTGRTDSPSWQNVMSLSGQYPQQQNNPPAVEWSFNKNPSQSQGSTHHESHRELDRFLVPYRMLQDAPVTVYNNSVLPNNSQPQSFASGSKNSTKREQNLNSYSEPKSYALLQHDQPGREPVGFNDSSVPFRDLTHDEAQNLERHYSSKLSNPKNSNNLQRKSLQAEWLGQEMSRTIPGTVNYIQRRNGNSGLLLGPSTPALVGPHLVFLPLDPSLSAAYLKGKLPESLKDFWKSMMPLGLSERFPTHVPGKMFQRRSSTADHQANGMNHPLQSELENEKQK